MADEPIRDDDLDTLLLAQGSAKTNSEGKPLDGFEDPRGVYPRKEYENIATTNIAARGYVKNDLLTHGGAVNVSLDLNEQVSSEYPLNQVRETVSGHITEIDDTPGAERILFRHRTGAGVELRADGSVIVNSVKNTVRITGGDEKVIVEGDGEIIYHGNLKLDVTGDFDLKVGGNFNVITGGNKVEDIRGSHKHIVNRNYDTTVRKNRNLSTIGVTTDTKFNDYNLITKGDVSSYIQGSESKFISDTLFMTAKQEIALSSINTNIAAKSLTVIGDSGTIGGDNIINYFYNAYGVSATFDAGVTAPTFHGDLDGTAKQSNVTASQNYGEAATSGAAFPYTDNATDTTATVEPTTAIMEDYLDKSSKGYRRVQIDIGDILKNKIDRTVDYGGVSTRPLSTPEVRSKLRDPKNFNNTKFTGSQISEGKLSPTYIKQTPDGLGRVIKNEPNPIRGYNPLGNSSRGILKRVQRR